MARIEGPVKAWERPLVEALDRLEREPGLASIEWDGFWCSNPGTRDATARIAAYTDSAPDSVAVYVGADGTQQFRTRDGVVDVAQAAELLGVSEESWRLAANELRPALAEAVQTYGRDEMTSVSAAVRASFPSHPRAGGHDAAVAHRPVGHGDRGTSIER